MPPWKEPLFQVPHLTHQDFPKENTRNRANQWILSEWIVTVTAYCCRHPITPLEACSFVSGSSLVVTCLRSSGSLSKLRYSHAHNPSIAPASTSCRSSSCSHPLLPKLYVLWYRSFCSCYSLCSFRYPIYRPVPSLPKFSPALSRFN
jgi:hypothetical protein